MEPYLQKKQYFISHYSTKHSIFFADCRVIIADSNNNLQGGVFALHSIAKVLELKYYQKYLRRWRFLGRDPVSCKFVVDDKCLHEVKNFRYLSCEISYGNEKGIQQNYQNLPKYWKLYTTLLNQLLSPQIFKNKSR
jgi:hypothetical protein